MLCDNGGHTFNPKAMTGLMIGRFWKFSFHLDSSGIGIFCRDQKLIIIYQCAQINSARFFSINLEAAKMAFSSALENKEHNSVSEIESVSGRFASIQSVTFISADFASKEESTRFTVSLAQYRLGVMASISISVWERYSFIFSRFPSAA